jgi:hypothetical protein
VNPFQASILLVAAAAQPAVNGRESMKLGLRSLALALLISPASFAQAPPDSVSAGSPRQGARDERGLSGFEALLRPGYGSAGSSSPVKYEPAPLVYHPDPGSIYDGSAAPYGAGLAGQLALGYRFLPVVSAGLYGELRKSSVEKVNDGSEDISRSGWGAGFYARGYAPMLLESFDPYLELGVGYVKDTQTYRRGVATTIGSLPGDWKLEHHGVAVPIALGIDYRVLPMLAVGPSFRYAYVFGAGACLRESVDTPLGAVSETQCSDQSQNQRITKAESYGFWSAGLDVRLTL